MATPEQFLQISPKFKLGCLLTQQQNPFTIGLAQLSRNDLPTAISKLKQMDVMTLNILRDKLPQLQKMATTVKSVLNANGRIYICGCGATGRLAIVLQTLWRQEYPTSNQVISFMAGGDAALIKSIQDFQDHPQFGQQQLRQLGFSADDLLIGSTEGGQTSWVIGAVWQGTRISKHKPYILYGNTDEILLNIERSREFILSEKIEKINCNVGHMALAGSTRMQSTTILMYAIGLTLFGHTTPNWMHYADQHTHTVLNTFINKDLSPLGQLIQHESTLYQHNQYVSYETDPYYAVTILTDTTQRSPTFSLPPFISQYDIDPLPTWCNLNLSCGHQEQWEAMLHRPIRGLNSPYWHKYSHKVTDKAIMGFSLTLPVYDNTITVTRPCTFTAKQHNHTSLKVELGGAGVECRLAQHILMKMVINNMSTLVMGRVKRYQSNIMTYVRPTNYKLIDRAARYVMILRKQTNYEEAIRAIYAIKDQIKVNEPIVLKVIEYLDKA